MEETALAGLMERSSSQDVQQLHSACLALRQHVQRVLQLKHHSTTALEQMIVPSKICCNNVLTVVGDSLLLSQVEKLLKAVIDLLREWHQVQLPAKSLLHLLEIILTVFSHCRLSESIYGNVFSDVSNHLMALFKSGQELLNSAIRLLELPELAEDASTISQLLSAICQAAKCLDAKTHITALKAFAVFVQAHSQILVGRFDVAADIGHLVASISEAVNQQQELKKMANSVKVAGFYVRIVVKLCEKYAGHLGQCPRHLHGLAMELCKCSRVYLQEHRRDACAEVQELMESYVFVGLEPLVASVVGEALFADEYFASLQPLCREPLKRLQLVLLTTALLKKLARAPSATRSIWLQKESTRNLLDAALHLAEHAQAELSLGTNYDSLLVSSGCLVASLCGDEFHHLERLLARSLLRATNPWGAVLTGDLWCLVVRYGSAQLCFDHVLYLVEACRRIDACCTHPRGIFVASTVRRLVGLLADKHKRHLVQRYPPEDNLDVWSIVGAQDFPKDLGLERRVGALTSAFIDKLASGAGTGSDLRQLLHLLAILSTVQSLPEDAICVSPLLRLWAHVASATSASEASQTSWFRPFVLGVLNATAALVPLLKRPEELELLLTRLGSLAGLEGFQGLQRLGAASRLAAVRILAAVNDLGLTAGLLDKLRLDPSPVVRRLAGQVLDPQEDALGPVGVVQFAAPCPCRHLSSGLRPVPRPVPRPLQSLNAAVDLEPVRKRLRRLEGTSSAKELVECIQRDTLALAAISAGGLEEDLRQDVAKVLETLRKIISC